MGLENSRDSFANLLDLKQEKEGRQEPRREGKLIKGGVTDAASAQSAQSATSLTGGGGREEIGALTSQSYEECCPQDMKEKEEHWPVWEMTGEDPWRDRDSDGDVGNDGGNGGDNNSIAECERIFSVPEVYDEMQQRQAAQMRSMIFRNPDGDDEVGPCHSILDCFNPWKQPTRAADDALEDATNMSQNNDDNKGRPRPKGAIKRSSMAVQLYLGMPHSSRQSFNPSMYKVHDEHGGGRGRTTFVGNDHRHLYSTGDDGVIDENLYCIRDLAAASKKKYRVHFSELKQVLQVRKFTLEEANAVWYQRDDFDFFKNEMSSLIQEDAASRQLAEAWLDAQHKVGRYSQVLGQVKEDREDDEDTPLTERSSSSAKSWWHDYDHSRRGLEKYASPGQARQILASSKVAVKKVLGEQHRQSLLNWLCVPGVLDPEKIAEVYHEYTAWSRDLALAAAASDADAVQTNFDEEKRHTREYYMLKQVVKGGHKVHKHMPQFMMPNCITPRGFLDEADSMFHDRRKSGANTSPNLLQSMINAGSQRKMLTGEEAREEMSRLHSGDLEGPLAPALAVSLQVEKEKGATTPKSPLANQKKLSMAAKAKNYPFQQ